MKTDFIEVIFTIVPYTEEVKDVLVALLADIGFDSFVDNPQGVIAYICEAQFNEDSLQEVIAQFPLQASFEYEVGYIEGKNWNEEWEKNYFQPLLLDDLCVVKSSFHKEEHDCLYQIIIDPKMAFGTGHHQTTELVMRYLLEEDISQKSLLDMGCGTAILAILASMRGADPIEAVDIDHWAYENAQENIRLNGVKNISLHTGDVSVLEGRMFDVILANINRNVLLEDIPRYSQMLYSGGILIMSGFYHEDMPLIEQMCLCHQIQLESFKQKDNWVAIKALKK